MLGRYLKFRGNAALGVVVSLLLVAGCQTGINQWPDVRNPSVLTYSGPLVESVDRVNSVENSITAHYDQGLHSLVTQVSANGTIEKELHVRRDAEIKPNGVLKPKQLPIKYSLSLQDAIATSLTQNPDLIAMRSQEGVSQAMLGVAKTYPWNPFVQAQLLPRGRPFDPGTGPGSGSGKSNYYVWVMQRFELAHQRRFREHSASAALNQTRWNIQQGELLNIAQTARLYFTALYQQEIRDLSLETARLNAELLGVVDRRFKAGLAPAAAVTTTKVAARQSNRQAQLAEATYQAAKLALRQQLNLSIVEPFELRGHLSDFDWLPVCSLEPPNSQGVNLKYSHENTTTLAGELALGRPDVMAAGAGVMVAGANLNLARAAMIPDIQAGPIYDTADDGTKFLGLRLQMELPVFNNGGPLARQRMAERKLQAQTYQQLLVRASREAEMAIDRYERARGLAKEAEVDLSPFSKKMPVELKEIRAQFQAGQADVLAVFATQNSLLQDRKTYLDLLNELAQSAAGVVQTTALPVERIVIPMTAKSRP